MENNIDINSIVKITQMPKIYTQLELIGEEVKKALDGIDNITCTDENKQEVKKKKQEITKFKNLMEDRRKEIKKELLKDYEVFNNKYELEVKNQLTDAETKLQAKISYIEMEQRQQKEDELRRFAEEHFIANEIQDIVTFEQIGLNITLSASEKSLKEQVVAFCDKVKNDLDAILLEDFKDEILIEYKNCLNYAQAKTIVVERHRKLEEIKKQQEELQKKKEEDIKVKEAVFEVIEEQITAPKEMETPSSQTLAEYEVSFIVYGTKDQLINLKKYMIDNHLKYEEVDE